jgi:hypothetical protein
MQNLIIEPTENTPSVRFLIDGRLSIEGRSLTNNVPVFYQQLIEWVKNMDVESVILEINLEYYNSISSKKLLEIMKIIDAKSQLNEFVVKWHYDIDDEESLEKGEIFEEKLKTAKFIYIYHNDN